MTTLELPAGELVTGDVLLTPDGGLEVTVSRPPNGWVRLRWGSPGFPVDGDGWQAGTEFLVSEVVAVDRLIPMAVACGTACLRCGGLQDLTGPVGLVRTGRYRGGRVVAHVDPRVCVPPSARPGAPAPRPAGTSLADRVRSL